MQSHNPLPLWFHPNQYEKSRKPRIQRLPWHVRAPACGIPNLLAISKIFMIDLYKWKRLLEVAKPKGSFPKLPHWGSRPTSHKTLPYCPKLANVVRFCEIPTNVHTSTIPKPFCQPCRILEDSATRPDCLQPNHTVDFCHNMWFWWKVSFSSSFDR